MPVRGVDLGNLVGQYRSPYDGNLAGGMSGALQFMAEQDRLKSAAAAQQKIQEMQEMRLMNQAGMANQMRLDQAKARAAQVQAERDRLDKADAAKAAQVQQAREDAAFGDLYKSADKPEEFNARIQELGRLGYTVEKGGGEQNVSPPDAHVETAETSQSGQESGPTEQATPEMRDVPMPAEQRQAAKKSKVGLGERYDGQPGEESFGRPAPARSLIENPGEAALIGGPGGVSESSSSEEASGAEIDAALEPGKRLQGQQGLQEIAGALKQAPAEQPAASPEKLPPAKTEAPFSGYRVRDKSGKVVFEFDPKAAFGKKGEATLGALDAIDARDPEEVRAKKIAWDMANRFQAGGISPDEAYRRAKQEYDYELERLGKVRRTGAGGGAASSRGGLSKKDTDKRFDQVFRLTTRGARLESLQKLNEQLLESSTASANLTGKGGFAQLNGLVHIVKSAQGGRVSDTDMRQAYNAAMGKIQQLQYLYTQYATSDVPMPPEAIRNIQEAQRLSQEFLRIAKRKAAIHVAKTSANNPDIKFENEEDRARVGASVANTLLEDDDAITPEEFAQTEAEGQAKPAPAPVKKKTLKQERDDLIKSM